MIALAVAAGVMTGLVWALSRKEWPWQWVLAAGMGIAAVGAATLFLALVIEDLTVGLP
jgi:hypothetical protein